MTVKGRIHSTESFGSVDGPGVRFVIFMQGCAMRCMYCHNPDTWDMNKGNLMSSEELLEKALRYQSYWGKQGGITISGGEPLLQIDFLLDLFQKAKQKEIHTVLDTSGNPFQQKGAFFAKFEQLMKYTDLILLDMKHIQEDAHRKLCAQGNKNILALARYLDKIQKPIWIRHVLVPGINDDEESLSALSDFIRSLSNVKRLEVLPYHTLGVYKWKELHLQYALDDVSAPDETMIQRAKAILHADEYKDYRI